MSQLQFSWQPVGAVKPTDLVAARRQAHNGAQFIARVGKYLLPAKEDDSHTSMKWDTDLNLFIGDFMGPENLMAVGFDSVNLSLVLINDNWQKIWQLEIDQLTARDTLDLLRKKLSGYNKKTDHLGIALHYEIEDALADDESFNRGSTILLEELTKYFSNAEAALHSITAQYEHTAEVRCWPHHFDIGTLIKLDPDITSEDARSVGIGLSPGDSGYPQPYFYVNLWPHPVLVDQKLPQLSGGHWHTKGWIGAVLTADEIVKQDSQTQQSFVSEFLTSAITGAISVQE